MSHRSSSLEVEGLELALVLGTEVLRKEVEELAWLEFPAHLEDLWGRQRLDCQEYLEFQAHHRCKSKSQAHHPFRCGQGVRQVQVDLNKNKSN
jgi:hypothetical protein